MCPYCRNPQDRVLEHPVYPTGLAGYCGRMTCKVKILADDAATLEKATDKANEVRQAYLDKASTRNQERFNAAMKHGEERKAMTILYPVRMEPVRV